MTLNSCLYRGDVMHHRLMPKAHRFAYPVTSWLIDLDELPTLDKKLRFFSYNRFNLLSFSDHDLGPRDGGRPKSWMENLLREQGIELDGGKILVHAFPRVLGLGFSPISTWFCYHQDGRLMAVHYEVHNTFGERHGYLAVIGTPANGHTLIHRTDKIFHVSPFLPVSGIYRFAVRPPDQLYSLVIREMASDADPSPILIATHTGRRTTLNDKALLALLPQLLALPFIVIGGIHWEALKLFAKRLRFHRKPEPPALVSLVPQRGDIS